MNVRDTVLFVRGMLCIIYGLDDLLNLMYAFTAPKGMYSRVQVFFPCINMKLKLTDLVKVSCQLLGVMKWVILALYKQDTYLGGAFSLREKSDEKIIGKTKKI